jgi:hypothetical protein
MEYKEATLQFGWRRLLIFKVFLGLHRKGEGGGGWYWARTFKCLWGPGIDAKEWIPPAYVVWRAGTKTLFLLGA